MNFQIASVRYFGFTQRRPALPGRQPWALRQLAQQPPLRSTKAGPSGPATPGGGLVVCGGVPISAQRRPALPGRQPYLASSWRNTGQPRSTKAGPSGPATLGRRRRVGTIARSLNEGRPFRAGNPRGRQAENAASGGRSTKAGPSGPATPVKPLDCTEWRWRAQRRPALPGRQPMPSSNEGPATSNSALNASACAQRSPALPGRQPWRCRSSPRCRPTTLNEGRPFRAGNPAP